jgi:hypothetical protein
MADQGCGWMYGGWKKSGAHITEWMNKTQEFIDRAFSGRLDEGVKCPCSRCRNALYEDKRTLTMHICMFDFMPGHDVWTHHNEIIHQRTVSVAEDEDDRSGDDRIDEMLDAIRPELETNREDPPTLEVQKFFDMLRASEESLHEHTTVKVLAFITRIMSIKSKFSFSNKYYMELLSLFSDVLPSNHKMPKDMYQFKKLLSALGMEYEKIDVCKDNCMIFYKGHKNETKCLKYGKLRFVEVINEDGEKVTIKTAHKQLCYMPLTPQMKRLFISKKTARHMRWHKEGVCENDQVMVHPSDSEAWKALDDFDPDFARDARNVRIGLAMDGLSMYNMSASSYSCWPIFAILYNILPALCMKYDYMFLCLIIPSLDHTGSRINVMLKPIIEELKLLWHGVEAYDYFQKQKCNL